MYTVFCRLLAGDNHSGDVHSPAEVNPHRRSVDVQATQLDALGHVVRVGTGSDVTRRRGRKPGVVTHVALRV